MSITERFSCASSGPLPAGSSGRLTLTYRPQEGLRAGSKLWLVYDIRQDAGAPQSGDPARPNFVSVSSARGEKVLLECYATRTLDLYPTVPEFFHACEMTLPDGMAGEDTLMIHLGGEGGEWQFPRHPIRAFHFWMVAPEEPGWTFAPTGYKTYRAFRTPAGGRSTQVRVFTTRVAFEGPFPGLSAENTRPTPGILWGDLHGMVFNQRPLDDYYVYAREVARFDFAAAMWFSYNVCAGEVWGEVKRTAERFTRPGEFVAVAGVEFGTPPDSSHRNAHFFHAEGVPPIFYEDRPPALEDCYTSRMARDTVRCRDLDDFYATIHRYGGIVSGHFHTLTYRREILAEIWQKQTGSAGEESRLFTLMNEGLRAGIVGGSDTHDSMPGNPAPEPHCPQTAGFMAVLADTPTPDTIHQAILQRRVYGTTGARIALRFETEGRPMGSVVPHAAPRRFFSRVEGSGPLTAVELIHCGRTVDRAEPSGAEWAGVLSGPAGGAGVPDWYLLRVTQRDGHRAWSSPIWFE